MDQSARLDAATDADADAVQQMDPARDTPAPPRHTASDDFLVPGPTPESNEGLGRWGLSWLLFSVTLILLMLLLSFVCWLLATLTGLA
jgi:hypothetical protein